MSCTPCTPPQDEFPIFCDPNPATDVGQRLLVEDEAFCQKALTSPTTPNQILKTNSSGNIQWGTVNSVLQSAPVDLGSQPLTTTGEVSTGALTSTSLTSTGAASVASLASTGAVTIAGLPKLTGLSIYANNAAAVTGGLTVNSVYKTATGELRIVV
jgi:hypothetical protein